jgi:hypothetical protein
VAGTCEPIDELLVLWLVNFAVCCGGSLSMQGNHRIGLDELINRQTLCSDCIKAIFMPAKMLVKATDNGFHRRYIAMSPDE